MEKNKLRLGGDDCATDITPPSHGHSQCMGVVDTTALECVRLCVCPNHPPHLGGHLEEGVQCQLCGLPLGVGEDDGATVSAAISAGTLAAGTQSQRSLKKDAWGQCTRGHTR